MTAAQIAASVIPRAGGRERASTGIFNGLMLGALGLAFLGLGAIIWDFSSDGLSVVSWDFISSFPSRIRPGAAGIESAIVGSILLMAICAVVVVPLGVVTAIYLEEYADANRWWNRVIEINIQNLSAVPSVVYGILGLAFIVRGPLDLGPVLLAGGITLGLLVLPVVIIVAREAIRAVPPSIREGSMALGATQWQTIWKQVLPGSIAGILTGVILALSRAIGETAPLLVIGAAVSSRFNPTGLDSSFTALPIQIFAWTQDPNPEFSYAGGRRDRRADDDAVADELRGHLAAQPIRAEVVSDDMPEKTERQPAVEEHVHASAASALPDRAPEATATGPTETIFDVQNVDVYYGSHKAVTGVNIKIQPKDHGADRPLRLRQVDVPALAEPHARADPVGARRGADPLPRPTSTRPTPTRCRSAAHRHGLPGAEPVPDDVDLRQRRGRPAAQRP